MFHFKKINQTQKKAVMEEMRNKIAIRHIENIAKIAVVLPYQ